MTEPVLPLAPGAKVSAPPGPVVAAAVVTLVAAATIGMAVLVAVVGFVLVGRVLLDSFDGAGTIVRWFFGLAAGVLALCLAAVVAAFGLLARRRWGWRTLLVLCPLTTALGLAAGAYVLPLVAAAAAVSVFVLLLLRTAREWIRPDTR